MRKIAIVAQRFGEEVNGGAELHARWLAEHLLPYVDVRVISTCAVDYYSWANFYPAGESVLNGVRISRFPVDFPRAPNMERRTADLLLKDHSLFDEIQWVKDQGPYSSSMLNYIQENRANFDYFIFFTYLYAPTYFGLPLVPEKAILVPTAHEEPYIELPAFRALFHLPQVVVYNTETEKEFVNRITGNKEVPGVVAGIGINVPEDISAVRFKEKYGLAGDFILYVGRVDKSKNVPQLFDFFLRYQQEFKRDLKLVLLGKVHVPLPDHPDIISLGFVSEEDKFDALQAATLLVNPSLYESLSMVTLEAWLAGIPVLVNGRCTVLKQQCRRSNGGLYYHTYDEFAHGLNRLVANPALRKKLGDQGRFFVRSRYDWQIVTAKYRAIFNTLDGRELEPGKNITEEKVI